MSKAIQYVRDYTQPLHNQLENCSLNKQLLDPTVTQAIYTQWLSKMRSFYETADLSLTAFKDHDQLKNYLPRPEVAWLYQDLQYWDTQPQVAHSPAPLTNYYQALGVLYVCEGSRFGARVIKHHLAKYLLYTDQAGATFLTQHTTRTDARWQQLIQYINAVDTEQEIELIAKGAYQAFDWAYRALT